MEKTSQKEVLPKTLSQSGMVANIYNLGRYRQDDQEEFKFILGYIMSLKPA